MTHIDCTHHSKTPLYLVHSFNILVLMQSLSGHTSAVESVSFDSTEVFVAAGAANGTIKLWDLEEAKSM
jgi:WD40 repeat protein